MSTTTEPEVSHTATPWAVVEGWPIKIVPAGQELRPIGGSIDARRDRENYGQVIGCTESSIRRYPLAVQKANAAFIVRACNAHDALVSAMKDMLACAEGSGWHCLPAARAAIELATTGAPESGHAISLTRDDCGVVLGAMDSAIRDLESDIHAGMNSDDEDELQVVLDGWKRVAEKIESQLSKGR